MEVTSTSKSREKMPHYLHIYFFYPTFFTNTVNNKMFLVFTNIIVNVQDMSENPADNGHLNSVHDTGKFYQISFLTHCLYSFVCDRWNFCHQYSSKWSAFVLFAIKK